jgi:hypothetical protein
MNFDWGGWTRGQWELRAVVLLGPAVALLALWPSAGPPAAWLLGLTLLVSAGWALVPDSVIGAVALLVVGFAWASGLEQRLPASALVAAAALLAAHLAAVVASYGPAQLPVNAAVVRLWALRGVLLFLPALAVWLLALAVRELPGSASLWVVGLVVTLTVIVVAAAATQAAQPQGDG